jgi:hypothetical protein
VDRGNWVEGRELRKLEERSGVEVGQQHDGESGRERVVRKVRYEWIARPEENCQLGEEVMESHRMGLEEEEEVRLRGRPSIEK